MRVCVSVEGVCECLVVRECVCGVCMCGVCVCGGPGGPVVSSV